MRPSKTELSVLREGYKEGECIEIVGIPDTSNETKTCELILEACVCLPSELRVSIVELVLKVVMSLSIKAFLATISSYGVNANLYGQTTELKLSELAMAKSKSELNLKPQFLELLTSQIRINYFQAMTLSLNKFTIGIRH